MADRYFHRSFLAKPNDSSDDTAVTARVAELDEQFPYLSAFLGFRNDYNGFSLHMGGSDSKEIKEAMRKADVIRNVVNEFADAVMVEGEAVMKAIEAAKAADNK